jgi:hypothetical protein
VAAKGSPKPPPQYVALAQVPSVRQRRQAENCLPCHPTFIGRSLIDDQATAVVVEHPMELLPSDPDRKAVLLGWLSVRQPGHSLGHSLP